MEYTALGVLGFTGFLGTMRVLGVGLWGRVLKTSAFRGEVLFRQDFLMKPYGWRDYSSLGLILI